MQHAEANTDPRIACPLFCCLTACSNQNGPELRPKHHDLVLFERAPTARQQKRFTVANLTLQTLINTYPESEYSDRARPMLKDPGVDRCGAGFSNTPMTLCEPDPGAAHLAQ